MARILSIFSNIVLMFHVELSYAHNIRWYDVVSGLQGSAFCNKGNEVCVDSGKKVVDGIEEWRNCWKYSYKKKCNFPSKNDCEKLMHCYEVGLKECLVKEEFGNCVNRRKEFSCKERSWRGVERKFANVKVEGNEASKVVCKGVPCIDGNCIDKSYAMDEDILKSVSKLKAIASMKDDVGNLFAGTHDYCRKRPVGYMSCCKVEGWGKAIGAGCNSDEVELQKKRKKNLCVYVGKSTTGTKPFHVNKHHFCCFGNLFNKVFQTEARKQLGIDFGDGYGPDCGGLTIEEISSLDFNKMDFSEFSNEIASRMKVPEVGDIKDRISSTFGEVDKETGLRK